MVVVAYLVHQNLLSTARGYSLHPLRCPSDFPVVRGSPDGIPIRKGRKSIGCGDFKKGRQAPAHGLAIEWRRLGP
jgi:hypothetical protein